MTFFRVRESHYIRAFDVKRKAIEIPLDCPMQFHTVCAAHTLPR